MGRVRRLVSLPVKQPGSPADPLCGNRVWVIKLLSKGSTGRRSSASPLKFVRLARTAPRRDGVSSGARGERLWLSTDFVPTVSEVDPSPREGAVDSHGPKDALPCQAHP
ncbi:hypothetical protein AOLI_G00292590 [Acnodon oligacanthus]